MSKNKIEEGEVKDVNITINTESLVKVTIELSNGLQSQFNEDDVFSSVDEIIDNLRIKANYKSIQDVESQPNINKEA